MAGGTAGGRTPKRLSVTTLDEWLHDYVYGSESAEDEDAADQHFPYPLDTCFSLWVAYRDKGTLPHAGGYLDQPRWWERMIRWFNRRYHPIYEQWQAEQSAGGRGGNDDDPYQWLSDGDTATGWEALKGTS